MDQNYQASRNYYFRSSDLLNTPKRTCKVHTRSFLLGARACGGKREESSHNGLAGLNKLDVQWPCQKANDHHVRKSASHFLSRQK